jgi:hypothetical protein
VVWWVVEDGCKKRVSRKNALRNHYLTHVTVGRVIYLSHHEWESTPRKIRDILSCSYFSRSRSGFMHHLSVYVRQRPPTSMPARAVSLPRTQHLGKPTPLYAPPLILKCQTVCSLPRPLHLILSPSVSSPLPSIRAWSASHILLLTHYKISS